MLKGNFVRIKRALAGLLVLNLGVAGASANDDTPIESVVADANLLTCLQESGYKTVGEVTKIHCRDRGITSAKGLEHFSNLTKLVLSNEGDSFIVGEIGGITSRPADKKVPNQLTEIDISHNSQLFLVDLSQNSLASIDVSNNEELETLMLSGNKLSKLDVSTNSKLTWLDLNDNKLTGELTLVNSELYQLNLSGNKLTKVNIPSGIRNLELANNQLKNLDLSKFKMLSELNLDANQLSSLDISHNKKLTALYAGNNQLSTIDLTANPMLQVLFLSNNKLKNIDLREHANLVDISLFNNPLKKVDVSKSYNLELLELDSRVECIGIGCATRFEGY
ncbi:leucine-rich repeat domain-containing protein [Pseudoalteromonas simplex]|uniref:hypothetical protein n=1 Tax=Pseudoalteromonas simplex TaxID=2783613 RepID=UPI0018874223|nr:hypothetical protein [Pseudoalteromonas sp. A520]